jgi:hypothetical protein
MESLLILFRVKCSRIVENDKMPPGSLHSMMVHAHKDALRGLFSVLNIPLPRELRYTKITSKINLTSRYKTGREIKKGVGLVAPNNKRTLINSV